MCLCFKVKLIFNLSFHLDNEDDEVSQIVQQPVNTGDLSIGSCVKVLVDSDTHYGVIRWIGSPGGFKTDKLMAAIELVILYYT